LELLGSSVRVSETGETVRPGLHVPPHQRPILVQLRPSRRRVLLEGEGQRHVLVRLAVEIRERAEAEAAKNLVQVGRAWCHTFAYAPRSTAPLFRSIAAERYGHNGAVSRLRSAIAGSAAATVWAILEPLDQRLVRCDYSDVALLGKAVTR